jgi:tetratricopeptide (TPR) repeat protein
MGLPNEAASKLALAQQRGDPQATLDAWEPKIRERQVHLLDGEKALAELLRILQLEAPEPEQPLWEHLVEQFPENLEIRKQASAHALRAGDSSRAARHAMQAAQSLLLRGDTPQAQEYFRIVIRCEPENQDALLYLAFLNPPGTLQKPETSHQVEILCREGLFEAAIHLVRKELQGSTQDIPRYDLLVATCRRAGMDPSSYLVAQAHLLLEEDPPRARFLIQTALQEAQDREQVVDGLQRSTEIRGLFSPEERLSWGK